ncbi:hypothetical protein LTR65_010942 [Meristemomyces frigidus]
MTLLDSEMTDDEDDRPEDKPVPDDMTEVMLLDDVVVSAVVLAETVTPRLDELNDTDPVCDIMVVGIVVFVPATVDDGGVPVVRMIEVESVTNVTVKDVLFVVAPWPDEVAGLEAPVVRITEDELAIELELKEEPCVVVFA